MISQTRTYRLRLAAAFLLLALLLAACKPEPTITPIVRPVSGGGLPARTAAFQPADCPQQAFGGQDGLECGFLTVPEDRSQPGGKTLRLAVTIVKPETASGGTPAPTPPDPLLFLGGSGRFARGMANALGDALGGRAIVLVDLRGTGRSEPALDCPELGAALNQQLDQPLFSQTQVGAAAGALETCRQAWAQAGVSLARYSSEASAADLEDLRAALGYDQWNVYASGSAARLAYILMRDYPASLRSAVIDATPPEDPARLAEQPANTKAALSAFFALCQQDSACRTAYPDIETRFYRQVTDLNAAPQLVEVTNLSRGERSTVHVDGNTLLRVTIASLTNWDERVLPELPRMVAQLENQETQSLSNILGMTSAGLPFSGSGVNWLTYCTETHPLISEQAVSSAASQVNAALAGYYREQYEAEKTLCAAFADVTVTAPRMQPVSSGVPVLASVFSLSPVSSPGWTQSATSGLTTAWVVTLNAPLASQSGGLDCMRSLLRAFLAEPASPPDAACAARGPSLRWITFQ